MKLLLKLVICVGAFLAASALFPASFAGNETVAALIYAGIILWLANLIIKPVAQLVSIPLTIMTFGLFSLIVNTAMVYLSDAIVPGVRITSFFVCLFIALVISAANSVLIAKK